MQTISCPLCGESLPESAGYCPGCGKVAPLAETTLHVPPIAPHSSLSTRQASLADNAKLLPVANESDMTVKLVQKERGRVISYQEPVDQPEEEDLPEQHATWQKVVTTTPHTLPALSPTGSAHHKQHARSRPVFWLGLVGLFALVFSSVFVVTISSRHATPPPIPQQPALQISPTTIALGGIITLRGAHFAPNSTLTLGRDQQLQLIDTGGESSIETDVHGAFSDTVIIDPNWQAGKHILYAMSTQTHQQATFSLLVTGQSALQGPPHLLLSADSLNFGAGDQTTNGNQLLAISNAGGGQLTWQASSEQPWLQISPASGSIDSGVHTSVIIAIDRAGLQPAPYTTSIVFTSNTEQAALPVSMSVIPLQPEHQAALQLSPAVLAFNATVNGPNPPAQTLTVSNPGVQPLAWGMTLSFQKNSGHWLAVSAQAGNVDPSGQQHILVSILLQGLTPGVYRGTLTFTNRGPEPIQGSPQSIFVSLIVAPLCTLTLNPGNLNFTGVHGQASPGAQTLQVGVASGCTTSQAWSVSSSTVSGGNWLRISQNNGSTPAQPQVSVNTAGLAPGRYTGTLTFTDHASQQIVPVTLTITPLACTLTAPTALAIQGTVGQVIPSLQNATLGSNGDCPNALDWTSTASVTTPSGGTWLSATPSGSLTPLISTDLTVQANLTGLSAGTYSGIITVNAVDSVTNQSIGSVQIAITLTVQPPCTLQAPSVASLTFTASVGSNPTTNTASFTINATGNCAGNVTITPSVDAGGNGWVATTGPATITSGGTATFTITITSATLAAGSYTSTITLNAADGSGPIAAGPQTVTVSLTVS